MAPSVAPTELMVVALLPLWGALLGGLSAINDTPYVIVVLWIALAWAEQRVLRLSSAYLLSTVLAFVVSGAVWGRFPPTIETAMTGPAVARAAMIALAWVSRPAASGLALAISTWAALAAMGTAILIAFAALDYRRALAMGVGAYLVVRLMREWSYRRKGGIDNTSLAVAKGLTEVMCVVVGTLL
jgi:hypothetical protein